LQQQQALQQQPGYVPTQTIPGQEIAGAGQEVPMQGMVEAVA